MKIAFGILSSADCSAAVNELASLLAPRHRVIVHHDTSKGHALSVHRASCEVLPNPVVTGWGNWGQTEAIVRLLRHAVASGPFDYFQLLSESCLPIRPLDDFETYLTERRPDACIGLIPIGNTSDDIGLLNFGWRCLLDQGVKRKLVARMASALRDPVVLDALALRPVVGGLAVVPARSSGLGILRWPLRWLMRVLVSPVVAGHPFSSAMRCHVGSTWFCMSQATVVAVLSYLDQHPVIGRWMAKTRSPDEALLHTAVAALGLTRLEDLNHFVMWTQRATGPDLLGVQHDKALHSSGKFFARKFSLDPADTFRRQIIAEIAPRATRVQGIPA